MNGCEVASLKNGMYEMHHRLEKYDSLSELEVHLLANPAEFYETDVTLSGGSTIQTKIDNSIDVEFIKDTFLSNAAVEYFADVQDLNSKSSDDLFSYMYDQIIEILSNELKSRKSYKVSILLEVLFSKVNPESNEKEFTVPPPIFRTFSHAILNQSKIPNLLQIVTTKFTTEMEYFNLESFGWVFEHIKSLEIKIIQYTPLKAFGWMPTPPLLRMKEASGCLLNIRNDEITVDGDHLKCFVYSIYASDDIGGLKGHNRAVHWKNYKMYKFPETISKVNFTGIAFPLNFSKFDDILTIFHEQNPDIALTVIGYHETEEFAENVYKENLILKNASKWQL
ncbi:unnamed protein product [Orchesella dallaii]|uniref:DUF38 domain-containing protein n=1 Tax=Orchesella dallaii TaxID=48710 RepID=A0ABP1PW08_9HEXA